MNKITMNKVMMNTMQVERDTMKNRLRGWVKRILYTLWKEQHEASVQAVYWAAEPCIHCRMILQKGSVFCSLCGKPQAQNTEAIQRVSHTLTLTDQIKAIQMPGEGPASAYWRLQKIMQGMHIS